MKLKISQPKLEVTYYIGDELVITMGIFETFRMRLIYKKKSDLIISLLFTFAEYIYRLIFVLSQSFFLNLVL